ncbi:carboxypeptidase regulatory-like domain-containing protein [Candidatus Chloroploca sp. M-50]|uniref:Carboxypeptidase regulatory-like domain-containing protein n=1 Tax=Candidatus Chloroploca mongolica TaxID=2528176 RepID=A0ABS4D9N8_9CHLR|nr:alpha/beta fold hydrolase [Candidatus Chloroploca mongolica]MBP1466165.1 carboxypeptidase regulatory-like domain-containing protein [Candidatus Chloroploca mongolica]
MKMYPVLVLVLILLLPSASPTVAVLAPVATQPIWLDNQLDERPAAPTERQHALELRAEVELPSGMLFHGLHVVWRNSLNTVIGSAPVDASGRAVVPVNETGLFLAELLDPTGSAIPLAEPAIAVIEAHQPPPPPILLRPLASHSWIAPADAATSNEGAIQQSTGIITGVVRDETSAAPVSGVRVRAGSQSAITDSGGNYLITGLSSGQYKVQFIPQGQSSTLSYQGTPWLSVWHPNQLDESAAVAVTVVAGQSTTVNAELPRGAQVSGTLLFPLEPVGVRLNLQLLDVGGRTHTEIPFTWQGGGLQPFRFTTNALPPGMYTLRVRMNNGGSLQFASQYYNQRTTRSQADRITLSSAGVTNLGNIMIERGGSISGVVTTHTGSSSAILVEVFDADGDIVITTRTDWLGVYTLPVGLTRGFYRVGFGREPPSASSTPQFIPSYYNNQPDLASATPIEITSTTTLTGINAVVSTRGVIRGQVTNRAGEGLPAVSVSIYDTGNSLVGSVTTDTGGFYRSPPLRDGTYRLGFRPMNASAIYVPISSWDHPDQAIIRVRKNQVAQFDQQLELGGQLHGRVIAADTGMGLPAVMVSAVGYRFGSARVATAADGSFTIPGLPSDSYWIEVSPNRNNNASLAYYLTQVALLPQTRYALTAPDQIDGVEMSLARGGQISGRVTAADSGLPLSDVAVEVSDWTNRYIHTVYSDTNGNYRTAGLPDGDYKLIFSTRYWNSASRNYALGRLEPIALRQGGLVTSQNISLNHGAQVIGRIVASDGEPVRAWIDAYGATASRYSRSDPDGSFVLAGIVPGSVRIGFRGSILIDSAEGGEFHQVSEFYANKPSLSTADLVTLNAYQTFDLGDILLDGGEALSNYMITGRVLDHERNPIAGATVQIAGGAQVTSDAEGNYSVRDLPPGEYLVSVEAEGYRFASRTLRVPPNRYPIHFVGQPRASGLCVGNSGFSPGAPASTDSFFVAGHGLRTDTPSQTSCAFTVQVPRFFGATLPGRRFPDGTTAPGTVQIELMLRHPDGGSARVKLHDQDLEPIALTHRYRPVIIELSAEQSAALINDASAHGVVQLTDNQKWIDRVATPLVPGSNPIVVSGPAGLEVAWAGLRVKGAMYPIVFVHGWTGSPDTFRVFATGLRTQPFTLEPWPLTPRDIPHLDVSRMFLARGVYPNEHMVKLLSHYIEVTRQLFGTDKVNMIAHSRGGVISRLALEDATIASQIDNIVGISAPHHGFDTGQLPSINCVSSDDDVDDFSWRCLVTINNLSRRAMLNFNYGNECRSRFQQTLPFSNCVKQFTRQEQAAYTVNFWNFNGDGLLEIADEEALPPWLNSCPVRPQPQRDGAPLDGNFPLNHVSINSHPDVLAAVLRILRRPPNTSRQWEKLTRWEPYHCGGTSANLASTASAPDYQIALDHSGIISAGTTLSHTLALPSGEPTVVMVGPSDALMVSLRKPDGSLITPTNLPHGVTYTTTTSFGNVPIVAYSLATPVAGNWQVVINASTATNYALTAFVHTSVRLEAELEAGTLVPGTPIVIAARLNDRGTALGTSVSMQALLDGQVYPLRDDGQSGDAAAGDGIFTATLPAQSQARQASITVRATWPGGSRQSTLPLNVAEPLARIEGSNGLWLNEPTLDGRWRDLASYITISAPEQSFLHLSGVLRDEDGAELGPFAQIVQVWPGTSYIFVRLDGQLIRTARASGLLRLTDLRLSGTLQGRPTLHHTDLEVVASIPIDWRDIASESITAQFASSGVRGADGSLSFSATVQVDVADTYSWQGGLYTPDGQLVATSEPGQQRIDGEGLIHIRFAPGTLSDALSTPLELRTVVIEQATGPNVGYFGFDRGLATLEATSDWHVFLPLIRRGS